MRGGPGGIGMLNVPLASTVMCATSSLPRPGISDTTNGVRLMISNMSDYLPLGRASITNV